MGEWFLRIARELNPKSSPYRRPVSDREVTYLVFPGSRKTKGPPDYKKWLQRCHEPLGEIGGLCVGFELRLWQNLLPKSTPPAPEVTHPQESGASAPAGEARSNCISSAS